MYLINYLTLQTADARYIAMQRVRTGRELSGPIDGLNVSFRVPSADKFVHDLPLLSIDVYYNGVRLALSDDYTVSESGGVGTGYDTVVLGIPPLPGDHLLADYLTS